MVAPKLFNHKWEIRRSQVELFIDVPLNIEEILKFPNVTVPTPECYEGCLKTDILNKRKELFGTLLRHKLLSFYE